MHLHILGECCGLLPRRGGLCLALLSLSFLPPHLLRLGAGGSSWRAPQNVFLGSLNYFVLGRALWCLLGPLFLAR